MATVEAEIEDVVKSLDEQAMDLVRKNVYWAMGVGAVPVPLWDLVSLTAVQVKMLRELSNLYGVQFSENGGKSAVASLAAGLGATSLGTGLFFSVIKAIPLVGSLAGFTAVPAAGAAFTYAVGKVFIQHFASGGTFLDFDPVKVRERFSETMKEGVNEAMKGKKAESSKA